MNKGECIMNKYIKKCLLIYISMAVILCGMVGVTYAITATDADQYVTRSQYAVDMAHLQNKLDEKEAGLLGEINRYRSTDIKFSTFDTPDKTYSGSGTAYAFGYYNGGNWFPRKSKGGKTQFGWGMYDTVYEKQSSNRRNNLMLYRLWNGNYFISQALSGQESTSTTGTYYYPHSMCAVPVEDLPGWYVVIGYYYNDNGSARCTFAMVKLDPTVPMPSNSELVDIRATEHTLRFKKELWQYNSDDTENNRPFKTTVQTMNHDITYASNISYAGALIPAHITSNSFPNSRAFSWRYWLDAETGDYIVKVTGLIPVSEWGNDVIFNSTGSNTILCRLIPRDNVEYLMGPAGSALQYYSRQSAKARWCPDPRYIGMGISGDRGWTHEIVDGVNGIKYYHAVYKPYVNTDGVSSYNITSHYSLPIVY